MIKYYNILSLMEIKYGCTRLVILTNKYAIKIPQIKYEWKHFLLGLLANIREIQLSKINDERLCPILFYINGGWIVVMPRLELISRKDFFNIDKNYFWPKDNNTTRYTYSIPVENKEDSFGYYNNKIVAIDYGG